MAPGRIWGSRMRIQLRQWVPDVERSWRVVGGVGTPKPCRSQGTPAFHCCGMKAVLGAPLECVYLDVPRDHLLPSPLPTGSVSPGQ